MDVLKRVEQKKILSTVESTGLLSTLDKAGVSLKKIEQLGLLSTAEKIGALSLLENVVETEPLLLSALALPCFATALAIQIIIPGDNAGEVRKYAQVLVSCDILVVRPYHMLECCGHGAPAPSHFPDFGSELSGTKRLQVALKLLITGASAAGFVTFLVAGGLASYLQQD